ncbi:thermonuclease family protein [Gulosibacter massiliensis]|uniref:thermonuclease family protein n=1 Tax=Gulosibacter massiliensis TaxID=2479839 RepID=UPI000F634BA5|nr:thermonuclease family protein [Gulosibacter massiliensis]
MGAAHSAGTATVGKVVTWSIAAVVGTVVVRAAVQGITGGGSGGDLDSARVVRVVDGDTIDVTRDGEEVRVRLLNIDTPETKDPDLPVQCLGPEATDFLEHLLPRGTRIELAYDEVVLDPYDRTLAAVFLDGELVNAQIAAEGLGLPVLFEPNDRFYNEVLVASESGSSDIRWG